MNLPVWKSSWILFRIQTLVHYFSNSVNYYKYLRVNDRYGADQSMTVPTKRDSTLKLEKYVLSRRTRRKIREIAQRKGLTESQAVELMANEVEN